MELNKLPLILTSVFLLLPLSALASSNKHNDFSGHRLGVGAKNVSVSGEVNADFKWSDDSTESFLEYGYDFNGIHTINLRYSAIDIDFNDSVKNGGDSIDHYSRFRGHVMQAEYELGYTFGRADGINIKPYGAIGIMLSDLSVRSNTRIIVDNESTFDEFKDDTKSTDATATLGVRVTYHHLYSDLRFQTDTRDHHYLDDAGVSLSFGVKF